MHTVRYTKHFLTGNLANMEVRCEVSYPNAETALRMLNFLNECTPEEPGIDCVTNARFYVIGAHTG
jgi:hypothetical protein